MAKFDDEYPGLPIKLRPVSNGEFVPPAPSDVVLAAVRRAREDADRNARRIGMSRRRFLLSAMGSATTLAALAACAKEADNAVRGTGTTSGPGGTFNLPESATTDPQAAFEALGGEEFVFDVQTHFLDGNHDIPDLGISSQFPQKSCGEEDPRDCFSVDKYLDLMFNKSDTSMLVISALPFAGSPLNPDVMKSTIDLADRLGCQKRVLMQGESHPSVGSKEQFLDNMAQISASLPIGAWKTYCHLGGPGWWLDDHDPERPQVGQALLDQVRELGPPILAVHKGFSNGSPYADPKDVGPAAKANPDISFVVYHSGFDVTPLKAEGPYDETNTAGVDRLITTLKQNGIGPGGNVYAELGSTWRILMGNPTTAAHVVGKLLVHFGEDNVMWGTDSIWYGAPQDQIEAFRAFEITPQFQDQFGYPLLTKEIKAKILGLNSARLYGVSPVTGDCTFDRERIAELRQTSADNNTTFGPRTAAGAAAVMAAELRSIGALAT